MAQKTTSSLSGVVRGKRSRVAWRIGTGLLLVRLKQLSGAHKGHCYSVTPKPLFYIQFLKVAGERDCCKGKNADKRKPGTVAGLVSGCGGFD